MHCWNCGKTIPDGVKACVYCEAPTADAPSEEEIGHVAALLSGLDDETQSALMAAAEGCNSAEQFADRILVGECLNCGSTDVGNCEHDPAIDNITIGRCYACGQLWCTLCDEPLEKDQTVCGHNKVCKDCEEDEAECTVWPSDCPAIVEWKQGKAR